MNTAIVLAGGSGRRMNSDIPKQYMMLKGKPVIYYSLKAFQDNLHIDDMNTYPDFLIHFSPSHTESYRSTPPCITFETLSSVSSKIFFFTYSM